MLIYIDVSPAMWQFGRVSIASPRCMVPSGRFKDGVQTYERFELVGFLRAQIDLHMCLEGTAYSTTFGLGIHMSQELCHILMKPFT